MKARISLIAIGLLISCVWGCGYKETDRRKAEIISDSIRIQDSLQIQLWADSIATETDSLQKLLSNEQ